ncbi:MAG: class I tRNA ligase family protein, partial [Candidatus Omnitrophica bacterium]|nr:class I tRNA ligase family protein [Candidatus Omnitrophota bacterium]
LNKLDDLCISRPKERLSWGIPLTFSPQHVAYVWFDALVNYISAVGTFDKDNNYVSRWWEEETEVVHLIGKDILRHHAVYWPIMLMALQQAGVKGIKLPDTIFAHGWWLNNNEKMSKSRGNVISPLAMADKFGVETYRYFLLRDLPFGLDGNFSEEAFIKRFNSDLANDLGNLVYRTLTMVEKYFQGAVPEFTSPSLRIQEITAAIAALPQEVRESLKAGSDFNFVRALEKIWEKINLANKYVEETKPWNLAKENKTEELKNFIRILLEVIRKTGVEIAPFMPQTAESIKEQVGSSNVNKGKPLFPRIEDPKLKK